MHIDGQPQPPHFALHFMHFVQRSDKQEDLALYIVCCRHLCFWMAMVQERVLTFQYTSRFYLGNMMLCCVGHSPTLFLSPSLISQAFLRR